MPEYDVVFNKTEAVSSDAALHTQPTLTSEILTPLSNCQVVRVSAANEEDARCAVRACYSGDVSAIADVPKLNWTEV